MEINVGDNHSLGQTKSLENSMANVLPTALELSTSQKLEDSELSLDEFKGSKPAIWCLGSALRQKSTGTSGSIDYI